MKIGDTIICTNTRDIYNVKGNSYQILDINIYDNQISITTEINPYHIRCFYRLNKNKETDSQQYYMFSEHFNTIKIIRRNKLKQIYK